MVLLQSMPANALQGHPAQLKLESGRVIRYVAAKDANPRCETQSAYDEHEPELHTLAAAHRRKSATYNPLDETDDWEGVNALCQELDTIVDVEMERDFLDGKSVLEIGYTTGLPSIFALESGAAEVALHCQSKATLNSYVKATMSRNKIGRNRMKLSSGDLSECKTAIRGKKFDIILAPEILNCPKEVYETIHELLDQALADDGICFMTSRLTYFNSSGSLPEFLSLLKLHRKFIPLIRRTSSKMDIVPRQVIQITRNLNF